LSWHFLPPVTGFLLFDLHGLAAAANRAGAAFGYDDFRAAFSAAISLAYCVRHFSPL